MRERGRPVTLVPALLLAVAAAGCGGGAQTTNEAGPVELVEGSRSEPIPEDVSVRIEYPRPNALSPDTLAEAGLEVEGFELGTPTAGADARGVAASEWGQHLHFVVDNTPYVAIYDDDRVIDISGLDTGAHMLRAFPARSWHESVKTEDAFAIRKFYVNDTVPDVEWEPDTPLLTYSRPKGLYRGPGADSIMVDFFVTNADLGPDAHTVRLTVDDTLVYTLEEWKPYYLLGLDSGEHTVKLDLLGPDGVAVPGPFNSTERVITVVRDTVGEGPMQ